MSFDPTDPKTAKLLTALRNMFPDEDQESFEFMMYFLSQTVDSNLKPRYLVISQSNRVTGYSSLMRLHRNAFGEKYTQVPIESLLENREICPYHVRDKFDTATFATYLESDEDLHLSAKHVSEILGNRKIINRNILESTKEFDSPTQHFLMTHCKITMKFLEDRHWQFIKCIPFKIRFVDNPSNPFERKRDNNIGVVFDDQEIIQRYAGYMQSMYEKLRSDYGGKLDNVPHDSIKRDTALFKMQNTL